MDSVLGNLIKSTPLFSFHSIIDEDVALIKYVYKNYYDKSIFDFSKVDKMPMTDLIALIYYRHYINPLKLFLVDESKEEFADECYQEFIEQKEKEILEEGVITEIPNLIKLYKDSSDIIPSIFYYTEYQKQLLDRIPQLVEIDKIHASNIRLNLYSQIYIKDYREIFIFPEFTNRTVYFAANDINVFILNNLEDWKDVYDIIRNKNRAAIFDIYNPSIIVKEKVYNDEHNVF